MKRNIGVIIFTGILALAQSGSELPKPYATPSVENRPQVVPQPSGSSLHAPDGFQVSVWAQGFAMPRFLLQGNSGEILLADSGNDAQSRAAGKQRSPGHGGVIYVFPNGDPAQRKELLSGLNRPYGMAFWKNYLYVAESDSVKRYPYDGNKLAAGKGEEVISLAGFNNGHWTRSLLFDRSGQKLYVGVGSESNVEVGEDPRRAAINRYNPDGSGHEIFASGTRNPIGMHWYPNSDVLWAAVQERDQLGDDLVPDYLTRVQQGDFYGWPFAYMGPHKDPRIEDKGGMVAKTKAPDVTLGSHVAVLDWTFYTGDQFPAMYHNGAFLAFHGSWNRSKRVGYQVAFLPFEDGKPIGPPRDFLTGWMESPDKKEVWGRPVAVFQMRDGSLLVTDDGAKKIWKVSYSSKFKG
jgi:glucose/arabinose dehydrogenase